MYVVSFCFVIKQNFQRCGNVVFDILITSKGAVVLRMFNAFRDFNRSLNKKRLSPAQTEMFRQITNDKQTPQHKLGN